MTHPSLLIPISDTPNTTATALAPTQAFDFAPGMSLRAIVRDGQPWFVAKDVCAALGYINGPKAIADHTEEDERNSITLRTGKRGNPIRAVISESGLYSLILRSTKPEAKDFRRWITGTVLPTLRQAGLYIAGQEKPITDDLTLSELMEQITAIQAKVDAINSAKVRAWSRHQEEKEARSDAFRFFKGKPARVWA